MTAVIGQNGEVVIPEAMRDELGLTPGTAIVFRTDGDVLVISRDSSIQRLGGSMKGSGMADRLLEDRRNEPR